MTLFIPNKDKRPLSKGENPVKIHPIPGNYSFLRE